MKDNENNKTQIFVALIGAIALIIAAIISSYQTSGSNIITIIGGGNKNNINQEQGK